MWRKMALALGVVAVLIAALVIFVERNNQDVGPGPPASSRREVEEENREARIVVSQDQRPHVVALAGRASVAGRASARGAVTGAVRAYMRREVSRGLISGRVMSSGCRRAGGDAARQRWRCVVEVSDVRYPFEAVVQPSARRITYCKRDAPPVPSMNIPVSPRCS